MDKRTLIHSTVVCAAALLVFTFVVRGRKEDPVPKQLWGYWITNAQGYEERYLELDDRYILIGINEEDMPDLQRVSRVNCQSRGEQMTCTLYSSNSETNLQLTLDYDPTNGGEIHIKNQGGIVWRRQPSS